MSTVSGLTPNSLTPSVAPLSDPAQQAQLRRRNETAVFSPVEESESTAAGQNRTEQGSSGRNTPVQPYDRAGGAGSDQGEQQNTSKAGEARANNDAEPGRQSQADAERSNAQRISEERAQREQLEAVRDLARRDREVRAHEQAHQTVGGQYAGSMKLDYTTGPDGRRYAVSGEVPIDLSPVPNNPEATRDKAQQVRQAALAPSEPSNQDRAVAAQATQLQLQAQLELRQQERAENEDSTRETEESSAIEQETENRSERSEDRDQADSAREADNARERLDAIFEQSRELNDQSLVREQYREQQATVGRNLDFIV